MNRFSELHDDERIVFCKIDHVMEEFRRVATLPHKVVMLIMNGDYSFTPEILKHKPHNVKHIFATNSTVYNNIVTPIPIGVDGTKLDEIRKILQDADNSILNQNIRLN